MDTTSEGQSDSQSRIGDISWDFVGFLSLAAALCRSWKVVVVADLDPDCHNCHKATSASFRATGVLQKTISSNINNVTSS